MGKWVTGDLHVHTHACADGTLPVGEIIARSRKYCDFIGISGHAYAVLEWGKQQYQEILEAREQWPDMPIFHTAEQNFPIERHTMFVTVPENREVELQREGLDKRENPCAIFSIRLNESVSHTRILASISELDTVYNIEEI